jgi:hypothetical protein
MNGSIHDMKIWSSIYLKQFKGSINVIYGYGKLILVDVGASSLA